MDWKGHKCVSCHKLFKEGDDIVVCPECGAPYHRACYAAEGRYPQSLDELKDRYGLQLDEEHYAVFYEPFGPNLMPNFTVLERQP